MHRHAHERPQSTARLVWTIVFNVVITAAEFVGGIISGYLALVADAIHNLSDVAALVLALLGEAGSRRPATKKSTYGLKRLEVITATVSAVALVVIAVYIFYEAYHRFLAPVEITSPALILTVAFIGLVGNVVSVLLLHSSGKSTLNIRTAFLHMFYDALSSVAVIVGAVVMFQTGWAYLDPILAVLIGMMILYSSWDVLKEAFVIFLEGVPRHIKFDQVASAIREHPHVIDMHHLHIWSLSSQSVALSCHIRLNPEDYTVAPQVIRELSRMLHERFGIDHTTIQPERRNCSSVDPLGGGESGILPC